MSSVANKGTAFLIERKKTPDLKIFHISSYAPQKPEILNLKEKSKLIALKKKLSSSRNRGENQNA